MNINWDDVYYMQRFIAKTLFKTNENFDSKYTNNIKLDLKLNKLNVIMTVSSNDLTYIKKVSKNTINIIENQIKELFNLKNPIKIFDEINKDDLYEDIYHQRFELIYLIDKSFIDKLYALIKIQNKEK